MRRPFYMRQICLLGVASFKLYLANLALVIAWQFSLIGYGQTLPSASDRFAAPVVSEAPDFQRHVVPLLGRLGCNGRACHGSFQGKGGLRLSLFGYDFRMDHDSLTGKSSSKDSSRVDRQKPDKSLILQKPLNKLEHEGGERFPTGSWQHVLLRRWIEAGVHGTDPPRVLTRLDVEPAELVFRSNAAAVSLKAVAIWEDGQREDVTPLCRFRTNNDSVAIVDADGRVASTGAGDTHIIVFYDNGITSVPVLRRFDFQTADSLAQSGTGSGSKTGIDSIVASKLEKLGIAPSEICTDSEFLRRVSLDLTGTLPTADEVESFLSDQALDKRTRKIDELIERPAYAACWANKLCDFTGCNPIQQAELGQETSVQWYSWIFARLRENVPYDALVRRIVLAKSRSAGQSIEDYSAQISSYFRVDAPDDFAQRESMPHYWTRRSMQKPDDAAQAFAHNFLGIRLQCAQCHKHPFALWTQDDFRQFSRFFENIKYGVEPGSLDDYRDLAKRVGLNVRDNNGSPIQNEILKQAQQGRTIPWRELYVARRDSPVSIDLLRSGPVTLNGDNDPREPIMDWMSQPQNPWFAKAYVNRVWAAYFNVGIIDPPDDLNPANPPSNPRLLEWLVDDFVEHRYDMKRLHKMIVSSQAYQRSWKPNATNRDDHRNYSRWVPRRMSAESVYDSVKQALASTDKADEVRNDLTRRAIGHLSMRLAGTYAMQVFGKPDRAVNCDCERVNQPTLLQSIFLQNDPLIDQRLSESGWLQEVERHANAVSSENRQQLDQQQLIRQAWLRTVSRPPTDQELTRALKQLHDTESITDGLRDLLWALLNTKEFVLVK